MSLIARLSYHYVGVTGFVGAGTWWTGFYEDLTRFLQDQRWFGFLYTLIFIAGYCIVDDNERSARRQFNDRFSDEPDSG